MVAGCEERVKAMRDVKRIYFDHNATAPLVASVRAAMADADERFGNPSSIHAEGRRARDAIEQARAQVARLVGADSDELVFTSGGTEGDHLAVRGLAEAARAADPRRTRVVTSPLEHPAVLGAVEGLRARGFSVSFARVDPEGGIVELPLGDDVALVTLALANHELGNVYPIAELTKRARAAGALVHTDAVQAAGKLACDVRALGVDAATISAHKLGGPKGVGAVFVARGRTLAPLYAGGHQERERRPGTENVSGIVGFGAATRHALEGADDRRAHVTALRDRLEAGALALGARRNGGAARVGNTANLAWEGVEGELLVESLDLEGVACSTGAACTSGSIEPSPVLLACHQSRALARSAVRFSLGPSNTEEEVERVLVLLPELIRRVRGA
jgi:cysteine desulfurase